MTLDKTEIRATDTETLLKFTRACLEELTFRHGALDQRVKKIKEEIQELIRT